MKGSCPCGCQDGKHEKSKRYGEHSLEHGISPTTLEDGMLCNIKVRLEYFVKKEYIINQDKVRILHNIKIKEMTAKVH